MTAVIGFFSFAFLLTSSTLGMLLFTPAALLIASISACKRQHLVTATSVLAAMASFTAFILFSLLASPASWQAMLAASRTGPPEVVAERARDVGAYWHRSHNQILIKDWYFLAGRWGVCHELWAQSACTRAPVEREAVGIAREMLADLANDVHWPPRCGPLAIGGSVDNGSGR
ncbi:hypothetical protein [Dokdonella sp.]|uniref:hypothetical protein n=1 Tax=Dokdonella sp. TaxID=2291710 RepID=UPI003C5F1FA4